MTTKTLAKIEQLAREGFCDMEIARRVGQKHNVVRYWRIKAGVPKGNAGKHVQKKRYTFYDRKTTRFLCEGTLEECAAALGLKRTSIPSIVCKARKYGIGKYEVYEVKE